MTNTPTTSSRVAYHELALDVVLAQLGSTTAGLSEQEAAVRLRRHGENVIHVARPTPAWRLFLAQLASFVVLLLVVAAIAAAIAGDGLEAGAIGAVLVVNTVIGFVVELRARRAMEALLTLDVPRASVVRDGRTRSIDARELVPGDVIDLEAGQQLPADGRLLAATDLRLNEAPLSGESLPVDKQLDPLPADAPLPDRTNMVYKGTAVAAGTGRAVVVATGMDTELGRIGGLVQAIHTGRTPLERRLDRLGHRLAWVALASGAAVAVVGAWRGVDYRALLETGLALAIAAVPEGLPAVATIALAVGMRRMARRNALVRRLPAVETLGSVTVICSDKTGTLTENRMTVTVIDVAGHRMEIDESLRDGHPGLVEDVTPRHLPLTSVQAVLQQLIAENVSIRDTRTLFETLAARAPKSQVIDELVETVRAALGRSIVDRLFEGSNTLQVIGMSAASETRLLNEMGDEGEALLSPATLDALNDAAERALAEQEGAGYPPVLLTSPGLRAMLSRLLRRNLPRLSVIAYAEVPADKMVQVSTELTIGEGA